MALQETRTSEDPQAIARYETIKRIGKDLFANSGIETGVIAPNHVELARQLLVKAIFETNPPVWVSLWDHKLIAPKLGRRLAEEVQSHGIDIDPTTIEFVLWLQDNARLITPGAYFRNDRIEDRLVREMGIPTSVWQNYDSTWDLMRAAEKMGFTEEQISFQDLNLTPRQEELVQAYYDSLTPQQKITKISDNLGKRGSQGLFDFETFVDYLKTQEERYGQNRKKGSLRTAQEESGGWPSVYWAVSENRRRQGALLQKFAVEKSLRWLESLGVDYNLIRQESAGFGTKFVIIARHGEVDNPRNIVYNRDSVMRPEDTIHLSMEGKNQMRELALIMGQRGIKVVKVETSPEIRAGESTTALNEILTLPDSAVAVNLDLDDNYSPGPYLEGMTMDEFRVIGGNAYADRWATYGHEPSDRVKERMSRAFWRMARSLQVGAAGILVSHGDPSAWWINVVLENNPGPAELRNTVYPSKGEGMIVILDSDNKKFSMYSLNPVQIGRKY